MRCGGPPRSPIQVHDTHRDHRSVAIALPQRRARHPANRPEHLSLTCKLIGVDMHTFKRLAIAAAALALVVLPASAAYAGSGGRLRIETAWYHGSEVTFLQPSLFSANPNGGGPGCFGLGPDLGGIDPPARPPCAGFGRTAGRG